MNCIILLAQLSTLVASYVYCARPLAPEYQLLYHGCYLLVETESILNLGGTQIVIDLMCLAAPNSGPNKYVSIPHPYGPIEYYFNNVDIVRMDTQLMDLSDHSLQLHAAFSFENADDAQEVFRKCFGPNVVRQTIGSNLLLEKIGLLHAPAGSHFVKYETCEFVSLNFVENQYQNKFIIEGSKAFLLFSSGLYKVSAVIDNVAANRESIVIAVEGFREAYYILNFNVRGLANTVRGLLILSANAQHELEIIPDLYQYLGME